MTASMILMILALIMLFLAAIPWPSNPHLVGLGWLGMFFWGLSLVIGK